MSSSTDVVFSLLHIKYHILHIIYYYSNFSLCCSVVIQIKIQQRTDCDIVYLLQFMFIF